MTDIEELEQTRLEIARSKLNRRLSFNCYNCATSDGKTVYCKQGVTMSNRKDRPGTVTEVEKGRLYIGCASCKYFDGG